MENLNKNIGEAIELQRKINKKTRKQLGDKIGVCYQQVQNYETGKHNITIQKLVQISEALQVSLIKLLPKELTDKWLNDKFRILFYKNKDNITQKQALMTAIGCESNKGKDFEVIIREPENNGKENIAFVVKAV